MSNMVDDHWPLMRALAWCLWANDQPYHDAFVASGGNDWASIEPARFQAWVRAGEAEQLDPPTLADALMDLWVHLQRGKLAAFAQRDDSDVWEDISATCWAPGSRLLGLSRLVAGELSYDRVCLSKAEVLRQRPEGGVQTALALQLHHDPDAEFSKSHWDMRAAIQWVLLRVYPDPDVDVIFDPSEPVTTADRVRLALNALTEAFHRGSVTAYGSASVNGATMQIREVEWPRLHITEDEYGDIVLRRRDGATAFVDISVDPLAVKAAWPEAPLSSATDSTKVKAARRGALSKYDWETYELLFLQRVESDGIPDETNPEGWRSQADVARFFQSLAKKDRTVMDWESAKKRAAKVCRKARG